MKGGTAAIRPMDVQMADGTSTEAEAEIVTGEGDPEVRLRSNLCPSFSLNNTKLTGLPFTDHRSRSRSPHPREPDRRRQHSPQPRHLDPKHGSRSPQPPTGPRHPTARGAPDRKPPPAQPNGAPPIKSQTNGDVPVKMDIDPDEDPETAEMRRMMGFGNFKSTKNTKVKGNNVYGVRKEKKTEYRQYMNRVGGFNRPLSPTRK